MRSRLRVAGPAALKARSAKENGVKMVGTTVIVASVMMLALSGASGVDERATQALDFPIPGHGTLRLAAPTGWQTDSLPLEAPASVTIHITPKTGDAFDVKLTSVWLDAAARSKTTAESRRREMQGAAEELLPHSVEKVATLREITGVESVGCYYSLTDREPGEGEFKYLSQGTVLTGEVLSAFTILYRTPAAAEVPQALRMLAEAKYVK
jgi:hypothetical protein